MHYSLRFYLAGLQEADVSHSPSPPSLEAFVLSRPRSQVGHGF